MTKEQAIKELKKAQIGGDHEAGHEAADKVLCEFLISLGHDDVVDQYHKVEKWYA